MAGELHPGWTGPVDDRRAYFVDDRTEFLSGGLGVVYRATVETDSLEVEEGTIVAVKLFTGQITDDRFEKLQERSAALKQVDHPHLAQLVDVFTGPPFVEAPIDEAEATERFCAHVWVEGTPLAECCLDADPLEILRWGAEAATAVDHLHTHPAGPFAHRDIHPRNIVISEDGHAVLIDYDTILVDSPGEARTQAFLPGTRFAPQERSEGIAGAQRDDRWSLARTILYALAGDPTGSTRLAEASAKAAAALEGRVLNPEAVVFELRTVLDGHDPGNARHLAETLRRASERYRLFRRHPSYDWEISPIDRQRPGRSRRVVLMATALIVLLGGSAGAGLYLSNRGGPTSPKLSASTVSSRRGPLGSDYRAAVQAWVASANAIAGSQDQADSLLKATADLQNGLRSDRNASGYAAAIKELQELSRSSERFVLGDSQSFVASAGTNDPAAGGVGILQVENISSELDTFFDTPLLYHDLEDASLQGRNYHGDQLMDTDFGGADLSDANLSQVNLSDANLSGSNLTGAKLSGSNLTGAELNGTNLTNANLSGDNLTYANLSGATMTNANITGAVWSGTTCPDDTNSSIDGSTCTGHLIGTVPTLGSGGVEGPYSEGFGEAEPSVIFNGGDGTGLVTDVTWKSWGDSQATGTGTSCYQAPNEAACTQQPATVVAFDLGSCNGILMYEAVEWFFPQYGQSFDPTDYENICTGQRAGAS